MNSARFDPGEARPLPGLAAVGPEERVAQRLASAVGGMFWRARIAMVSGALAGLAGGLGYGLTLAPAYTATAQVRLPVERPMTTSVPGEAGTVDPPPARAGDEGEFVLSPGLLRRVVRRLGLERQPELASGRPGIVALLSDVPDAAMRLVGLVPAQADGASPAPVEAAREQALRRLSRSVGLRPVPDTRVVAISATTADPQLSAAIAEAVAGEYVSARREARRADAEEATRWLSGRIAALEDEIAATEVEVTRRRAAAVATGGAGMAQLKAQLISINRAIAAAATARSAARIRYHAVRAAIDGGPASEDLETSDVIRLARAHMRGLAADRAALGNVVTLEDPRLARLDASRAALERQIAEEAERIALVRYSALSVEAAKERRLREASRAIEARIDENEAQTAALRSAENAIEMMRINHDALLGRLDEVTRRTTLDGGGAAVVSPGEAPSVPDAGGTLRFGAFGGLLGLMGGFAISAAAASLDRSFRSPGEVEDMTGLPVLGAIPFQPEPDGDVFDHVLLHPRSPAAEAVRGLRAGLLFAHVDRPAQVVLVTSSLPGEGKSTTGVLLAMASAQAGRSTILVDCDLRRSTLSGMLGAVSVARGGLRAILDGTTALEHACLTDPETGLAILPTRAEPDTGALTAPDALTSRRFGELLTLLRERYEFVVLDAPAALQVGDARLLARHADATLYCIRWGDTPREAVYGGLRALAMTRSGVTGAVLTMIDRKTMRRAGASAAYWQPPSDAGRAG